jgi:Zn-finger nucleic acid-binding protein
MICPVCKNSMVVLELEQVEIDYCISCGGIWLDAGELELLLETEQERARLLNLLIEDDKVKEKSYRCPICSKKMKKVFVGEDRKILIDKCKKNHGLWLDKGELELVIELSSKNRDSKIIHLLKQMFANSAGG